MVAMRYKKNPDFMRLMKGTHEVFDYSGVSANDLICQTLLDMGYRNVDGVGVIVHSKDASNMRAVLEEINGSDWEDKLHMAFLSNANTYSREDAARNPFKAQPLGEGFMDREIPAPRALVPHILPMAPFGFVGAGGASKTTTAIKIGLHVITGRPLWGESILFPGPVVMITKEDTADEFAHRIQQIVKQEREPFTLEERKDICANFYVEDLSGVVGNRFVEMDSDNMRETEIIEHLIMTYRDIKPSLIWIDPAVYFGPGERYVNDGEAALMMACRKISNMFQCAVGVIHHVSQSAARTGIADAHTGRGGTAFGDNARGMLVLRPRKKVDSEDPLPNGISQSDVDLDLVTDIQVVKLSHGRPVRETLFVKRTDKRPFQLDFIRGAKVAASQAERERQVLEAAEARNESFYRHYVLFIEREAQHGRTYSVGRLRAVEPRPVYAEKKLPKNDVDAVVHQMLQNGLLRWENTPQKGGQQRHLVVTDLSRSKYLEIRAED